MLKMLDQLRLATPALVLYRIWRVKSVGNLKSLIMLKNNLSNNLFPASLGVGFNKIIS